MTVQTINIHQTGALVSALSFTSVSETLQVAVGVIVASDTGVGVDSALGGSSLINHGDIEGGLFGVGFSSTDGFILNAADGTIGGPFGIGISKSGGTATAAIVNLGTIMAASAGAGIAVDFNVGASASSLDNRGTIYGQLDGVLDHSTGTSAFIQNSGSIEGGLYGIDIRTAAGKVTTIVNSGTIRGTASVHVGTSFAGGVHLTNTGNLIGAVSLLSNQNDADVVTNSGKIAGTVALGGGNDSFTGTGGSSGGVFGEAGNDRLIGGATADIFSGGGGNDILTGGPGADHFLFDTAIGPGNIDTITDFHHGSDKIELSHKFFAGTNASGPLAAAKFAANGVETAATRVLYNPANGFLSSDADGSAHAHAPIHFATLAAHLALTSGDFLVVA